MKKTFLLLVSALLVLGFAAQSCNPHNPEEEEEIDPADLERLKFTVEPNDNWVYDSTPTFLLHITNPNDVKVTEKVKLIIKTDKGSNVSTEEQEIKVPANGLDFELKSAQTLDPGFYRATIYVGRPSRSFVFGIDPTHIVSAPDMQADFNSFWEATKQELYEVDMRAELTEITSHSSAARKVYLVEIKSIPDTAGKEPVTVRGYYLEPQDGKKHPVLMHYYGYDELSGSSKVYCPYGGSDAYFAEFYLCTRGQVLNNRKASKREEDGHGDFVNIYGDWFAYNFGHRDNYYYRGAFMDCIQGVRFMASRPTSDISNLFAEGSSQGGAFSYAAASLSDYPFTAIAPCVAFLGDFPDYFQIVGWPANTARENKGSMTDEEMYQFLSYFDTKNLATRIPAGTAVIACSGLQDGTCPPHTNIAPFNNLKTTDKEYYYYPEMQHTIPADWESKITAFFKARIK